MQSQSSNDWFLLECDLHRTNYAPTNDRESHWTSIPGVRQRSWVKKIKVHKRKNPARIRIRRWIVKELIVHCVDPSIILFRSSLDSSLCFSFSDTLWINISNISFCTDEFRLVEQFRLGICHSHSSSTDCSTSLHWSEQSNIRLQWICQTIWTST